MESPSQIPGDEVSGKYPQKTCSVCGKPCSVSLFHRNAKSSDGLDNRCAPCKADLRRLERYDLKPNEYKRLLVLQNYECAICRRKPHELEHGLVVDHDHETGKVRGLACPDCNKMLGFARDNVVTLRNGAIYLEVNKDD